MTIIPVDKEAAAALAKPLKKLIEVVSKGVGALSNPFLIVKNAEASARAMKIAAQGEAEALAIRVDSVTKAIGKTAEITGVSDERSIELQRRAVARLLHVETERQGNIDSIVVEAQRLLPGEVSEVPVDADWINRFFEYASGVSSEQMQAVWAKILAGEVSRPGSFHPRTLLTLRNINQLEAEIFERACSLATNLSGEILLSGQHEFNRLGPYGLSFNDMLHLKDAGLLLVEAELVISIGDEHKKVDSAGEYFSVPMRAGEIKIYSNDKELEYYSISFTNAGVELMRLMPPKSNNEFFMYLKARLESSAQRWKIVFA